MRLPTVTINRRGKPVIINETDYDPKVHDLYEVEESEPEEVEEEESLDDDLAELLSGAGIDSPEKIRAASDDDLRAIKGIGPAKLREIRELYPSE